MVLKRGPLTVLRAGIFEQRIDLRPDFFGRVVFLDVGPVRPSVKVRRKHDIPAILGRVENPCAGTTFELAAIGIDPGYFNIDNPTNARKVNLTFDVHGAPPYASSERDEDDGFRIGWNNCYNLTRIDNDWRARSANMYNKYSRDVGYARQDSPSGSLRLTRNGSIFNAYYKDKFNPTWVCSGSALVPNLGEDVYIRLAAKHWQKGDIPPANTIVFKNFRLYQY